MSDHAAIWVVYWLSILSGGLMGWGLRGMIG